MDHIISLSLKHWLSLNGIMHVHCTYFALFEFFGLSCWGPAASLLNFIEHITGAKCFRDGQFLPLLITMRGRMALRIEVPMAAEGRRGAFLCLGWLETKGVLETGDSAARVL